MARVMTPPKIFVVPGVLSLLCIAVWSLELADGFKLTDNAFYDRVARNRPGNGGQDSPILLLELPSGVAADPDALVQGLRTDGAGQVFLALADVDRPPAGAELLPVTLATQERGVFRRAVLKSDPEGKARLIDFFAAPPRIPRLSYDQLLRRELVAGALKERGVLVARSLPQQAPGLSTPLHDAGDQISLGEVQAYALVTAVRGSWIREIQPGMSLLLIMIAIGLGYFAERFTLAQVGLWILLVLCACLFLVAWIILSLSMILLPISAMIAAHSGAFFLLQQRRLRAEAELLRSTSFYVSQHLHQRSHPNELADPSQTAALLGQLVSLVLGPERYALWESDRAGAFKLIAASRKVGLSPAHLAEELTRSAESAPPIPSARVFDDASATEVTHVSRLIHAGEKVGLWALSFEQGATPGMPLLKAMAGEAARVIDANSPTPSDRVSPAHALNASMAEMELYVGGLENLFENLSVAAVMYDLYGRAVLVNNMFKALAARSNAIRWQEGPVHLLRTLTGLDDTQSRRFLRHAYIAEKPLRFAASVPAMEARTFVLTLSAVGKSGGRSHPDIVRPEGIAIELHDITGSSLNSASRETIVSRLATQLRNDLEAFSLGVEVLDDPDLAADEREEVALLLRDKTNSAAQLLLDVEHNLQRACVPGETLLRFPVDTKEAVARALTQIPREIRERIDFISPEFGPLAFAAPQELSETIGAALTFAANNCTARERVRLELIDEPANVEFQIVSPSSVLPEENLQKYLFGTTMILSSEFRDLRNGLQLVERWGGTASARFLTDSGLNLRLGLEKFL